MADYNTYDDNAGLGATCPDLSTLVSLLVSLLPRLPPFAQRLLVVA